MTHTVTSGARVPLRILSDDDLEQLDQAACQVLERVGVSVPSARAREALRGAGARVDGERVTIPTEVLRGLLAKAPPRLHAGRARRPHARHRRAARCSPQTAAARRSTILETVAGAPPRAPTWPPSPASSTPCRRSTSAGRPSAPRTTRWNAAACGSSTSPSPTRASTCRRSPSSSPTWPRVAVEMATRGGGRRRQAARGAARLGPAGHGHAARQRPRAPSRRASCSPRPACPSASSACRRADPPRRSPWPARWSSASPRR